jgi:hypothetical protein
MRYLSLFTAVAALAIHSDTGICQSPHQGTISVVLATPSVETVDGFIGSMWYTGIQQIYAFPSSPADTIATRIATALGRPRANIAVTDRNGKLDSLVVHTIEQSSSIGPILIVLGPIRSSLSFGV